jgi:hypothetical protein
MRKLSLIVALTVTLATLSAPAYAKRASDNSWTQLDNHNWPKSSSDPDCSPCVRWPKGSSTDEHPYMDGIWNYALSTWDGRYHTASQRAVYNWSGQPYRSPVFDEGASGSSSSVCANHLCVRSETFGSPASVCGVTYPVYDTASNLITRMTVYLGVNQTYWDGPPPKEVRCNLRSTLAHEVGHAFSEGHSFRATDLMYWGGTNVDQVDPDAELELKAVYGALPTQTSGGGACPCIAIDSIKQKFMKMFMSLDNLPTATQVPTGEG